MAPRADPSPDRHQEQPDESPGADRGWTWTRCTGDLPLPVRSSPAALSSLGATGCRDDVPWVVDSAHRRASLGNGKASRDGPPRLTFVSISGWPAQGSGTSQEARNEPARRVAAFSLRRRRMLAGTGEPQLTGSLPIAETRSVDPAQGQRTGCRVSSHPGDPRARAERCCSRTCVRVVRPWLSAPRLV